MLFERVLFRKLSMLVKPESKNTQPYNIPVIPRNKILNLLQRGKKKIRGDFLLKEKKKRKERKLF